MVLEPELKKRKYKLKGGLKNSSCQGTSVFGPNPDLVGSVFNLDPGSAFGNRNWILDPDALQISLESQNLP